MLLRLAFFGGKHVPQPQGVEQTGKQRTQYHNSDCPTGPPPSLLAAMDRVACVVGDSHDSNMACGAFALLSVSDHTWSVHNGFYTDKNTSIPVKHSGCPIRTVWLAGVCSGSRETEKQPKDTDASPEGITVREDRDQTPGAGNHHVAQTGL